MAQLSPGCRVSDKLKLASLRFFKTYYMIPACNTGYSFYVWALNHDLIGYWRTVKYPEEADGFPSDGMPGELQ